MTCFWLAFGSKAQYLSRFPGRVATFLRLSPQDPCERTLGAWNCRALLLDPALYGAVCPSGPSHLVFWRVDTSLLSEESLLFRIQMVIRKKAKLICRDPTRHIEYIPHLYSFLLAHGTPNPAGKKLLHFIAVTEKVTNHPVTRGPSCLVTGVTNFQFIQFTAEFPHFSTKSPMSQATFASLF